MIAPATYPKIEHPSERMRQGLAAEVMGALWSYDPLRSSIVDLAVTAEDGLVRLAGIVRGSALRSMAQRLAQGVPGVTGVQNDLLTDTDVESEVAVALAGDEGGRLLTDRLSIKCIMGTLHLGGTVAAPELALAEAARARASDIARSVHGVRNVVNQVVAVEEAGTAAGGAAAEAAPDGGAAAPEGDGAVDAAMSERLQVWRERSRAR